MISFILFCFRCPCSQTGRVIFMPMLALYSWLFYRQKHAHMISGPYHHPVMLQATRINVLSSLHLLHLKLWQRYERMEEGRAGRETKIASSDLSFINFSTPAATLGTDFGRGRNTKISCQMNYLVTVSAAEPLLIKIEVKKHPRVKPDIGNKAVFTL